MRRDRGRFRAGRFQRRAPRIDTIDRAPCGKEVACHCAPAPARRPPTCSNPQRRATRLHVARPDHHVVEIVALAMKN